MIWNLILHIALGYFGSEMFTSSDDWLFWLLGVTSVVQGLDMIRFRRSQMKLVARTSNTNAREKKLEHSRTKSFKLKLVQVYLMSVVFYGFITWLVAYIVS